MVCGCLPPPPPTTTTILNPEIDPEDLFRPHVQSGKQEENTNEIVIITQLAIEEAFVVLKKLTSAPEPGRISAIFLKKGLPSIKQGPLHHLVTLSAHLHHFRLFKACQCGASSQGRQQRCTGYYRPIAITSHLIKSFKVFRKQFLHYPEVNHHQSGQHRLGRKIYLNPVTGPP